MASKVKVTGKSQNRTALGIIHAYCKMNPGVNLEGLRKAFPNSVCPDAGVKELFLPIDEAEQFNTKMSLYFTKAGEPVVLADGSTIALAQVWSKSSLDKILTQAANYDITASDPDKSVNTPAGFTVECLNGYSFPKAKKGCFGILLLPLIAAGGALAYILS